jgi:hypothetical protein
MESCIGYQAHLTNDGLLQGIALQTGLTNVIVDIPPAGRSPGDPLEYALRFRIPNDYTHGDIQIADVLSDGQVFDGSYTPTFDVWNRGAHYAGTFTSPGYAVLPGVPAAGQTTLDFLVSDQLSSVGLAGDMVQGGRAFRQVASCRKRNPIPPGRIVTCPWLIRLAQYADAVH